MNIFLVALSKRALAFVLSTWSSHPHGHLQASNGPPWIRFGLFMKAALMAKERSRFLVWAHSFFRNIFYIPYTSFPTMSPTYTARHRHQNHNKIEILAICHDLSCFWPAKFSTNQTQPPTGRPLLPHNSLNPWFPQIHNRRFKCPVLPRNTIHSITLHSFLFFIHCDHLHAPAPIILKHMDGSIAPSHFVADISTQREGSHRSIEMW